MNQKIYRPIAKCLLCGQIFEPSADSTTPDALESYKYLHQCDARVASRKGFGKLIGFIMKGDSNESSGIQDSKIPVEPSTGRDASI